MNRTTRTFALVSIVGSLALVACDNPNTQRTGADTSTPATSTPATAERSAPRGNETTATSQSNSSEHIEITATIRRAVMDDDNLSMGAKNATIVTDRTGTVTLRGDVESQSEKDSMAAHAAAVVGSNRVVNQLVVNADRR